MNFEGFYDLLLDNLKKLLYPQDWIDLDLSFSKSEHSVPVPVFDPCLDNNHPLG